MTLSAYYNDNDSFCCDWLSNLMDDGLITPGTIDNRSIADVVSTDLLGYERVHLFAGIGIWDAALNGAGWRGRVWTASCPCPPFSSAGKNFRCPECDTASPVPNAVRTGAFNCIWCDHEWRADGRHLWPEVHRLARDAKPELILGEQVASKDGRTWIDVVRASLEMLGYAVGHPDVPACGFGAPHIRQRLYWMAEATGEQCGPGWTSIAGDQPGAVERSARLCEAVSLADADDARLALGSGQAIGPGALRNEGQAYAASGLHGGLADTDGRNASTEGLQRSGEQRQQPQDGGTVRLSVPSDARSSCAGRDTQPESSFVEFGYGHGEDRASRPGPLNGLWRDADWLCCTDGKWRPVAPGTFPLAPSGTVRNRVGLLRGAGNAINLAQAQGFVEAVIEVRRGAERLAA